MRFTSDFELLCIRHGETRYTDKFPDLTAEGESHVRRVALGPITAWLKEHQIALNQLAIVSSSAPRAHGTGAGIALALGHTAGIVFNDALAPMERRDLERARAVWKSFGDSYVHYEMEPIFVDPAVFETPDEVRKRWYRFLSQYIIAGLHSSLFPRAVILVSHYEVLCWLTNDLFGIVASESTHLRRAEHFTLSVSKTEDPDQVVLQGNFRGEKATARFDLLAHTISAY